VARNFTHAIFGEYWVCEASNECYDGGDSFKSCTFAYDDAGQFNDWLNNRTDLADTTGTPPPNWCVAPTAQKACCPVLKFGEMTYYSDVGGVKVI